MEATTPVKPDRKTVERNRRNYMKSLIYKLTSLVPPQHFHPSKDMLSQQDQLEQIASYIKKLRERVDKLEKTKDQMTSTSSKSVENSSIENPIVKVRDVGSSLEVVIITGKKKKFALHDIIRIVEEEGAEVVTASTSTVGLHMYHILHAQVKILRFGVDSSVICDRFQALVSGFTSK